MKDGLCPKCASNQVYKKNEGIGIGTLNGLGRFVISGYFFSDETNCDSYICVKCGYFENYITNPEALAKVGEKWEKVGK